VALLGLGWPGTSHAADGLPEGNDIYSSSDYGGVGLLNMRTARFSPDGQFEFGLVAIEPYRRYYMNWQILPFLEVTFRYTDVTNVDAAVHPFSQSQGDFFKNLLHLRGGDTYLDRAFDFKLKLWDEGKILPAAALGLQDTVGTGLVSGEYLVFTKRVADFDLTAGLGWGYFATRNNFYNPLRILSGRFDQRSSDFGLGGKFSLGNFFSGRKVGLFGGVEYFTPIKSLSLKLEYNSADPAKEPLNNPQSESLPIDIGINYRPFDWFNFGVGFERGKAVMVKIAMRQNFHLPGLPHLMDPPPPAIRARPDRPLTMPQQPGALAAPSASAMSQGSQVTWLDLMKSGVAQEKDRRIVAPAALGGENFAGSSLAALVARQKVEQAATLASGASSPETPAPAPKADDNAAIAKRLSARLKAAGYPVEAVELKGATAVVYYLKTQFLPYSRNLGRIARIMANELPGNIEQFTIVYVGKGLETSRVSILRKDLENAARHRGSPEEIWANTVIEEPHVSQDPGPDAYKTGVYPEFTWSLRPKLNQYIGDPDIGLWAGDLRAAFSARLKLNRNLWFSAAASKLLFGNLDNIKRRSNSVLPHVRSDVQLYAEKGRDSIDQIEVDYLFRPGKYLYGRVSAGIFETMYGGVGGELLWYKQGLPVAFGLDLNWVKKRDFNQGLGFQDYETVTGNFSIYYDLPFYNMSLATSFGRYLAKDKGVTFDLSRRFDSGIVVGGFFTLTNVSARDFGEGSFDKGFYMSIPLDMFLLRSSTRIMGFAFRPITRDGGQRVSVGPRLQGVIGSDNATNIRKSWEEFLK
jgi:hypothetical protein